MSASQVGCFLVTVSRFYPSVEEAHGQHILLMETKAWGRHFLHRNDGYSGTASKERRRKSWRKSWAESLILISVHHPQSPEGTTTHCMYAKWVIQSTSSGSQSVYLKQRGPLKWTNTKKACHCLKKSIPNVSLNHSCFKQKCLVSMQNNELHYDCITELHIIVLCSNPPHITFSR